MHQICSGLSDSLSSPNHLFLLLEDRSRIATKKIAMSVAKNICLWRKFVPKKKNLPVLANASSCYKEIKPGTMHIFALGMLTFNVIRLAQCLCQANKQHKKSFYVADNLLKIGGILKCTPTQQLLATGRGGERVSS